MIKTAKRIGVDEYHTMIETGELGPDDRVELLEGEIEPKMTIYPKHRRAVDRALRALSALALPGWYVTIQQPITTDTSEPEPDVSVIRGTTDDYPDRHPGPGEIALVGEVADDWLPKDQIKKKRIYARAGIPTYWIINLVDDRIEVYTDPSGPAAAPSYAQRTDYPRGSEVPVVIDGREIGRIPAGDILP